MTQRKTLSLLSILALAFALVGCPETDCDDADVDGVCDDVDVCDGSPDQADYDGDGTPDGCDGCPLDASGNDGDADEDGVCDSTDLCEGFLDSSDFDADTVPDGCDDCPLDPTDSVDTDGDTVCDMSDICEDGDDLTDTDGDEVPDDCDICPAANPDDSDNDGVCEDVDLCLGDDATGDMDGDGVCEDSEPLNPPRRIQAAASGADVTLTWTNPGSMYFGSVVVVRQYLNVVDGAPETGEPTVGDAIGTAGEVVYVGSAESFTDSGLEAGAVFYKLWSSTRNTFVHSEWAQRSWELVDTQGPQTGTVSIDLATGAVTVTSPSHFTLEGTSVVSTGKGTSIDLSLSLTSTLARRVFHPKLAVTNLNDGETDADAEHEGDDVFWFGPEAMLPGVAVDGGFGIYGLDGSTDPITFEFEIRDHQGALHPETSSDPAQFTDLSGTGLADEIDTGPIGYKSSEGQMTRGFMLEDGSVAYGGARNEPVLAMLDTETLTISTALNLTRTGTNGYGSVPAVRQSPDGRWIYATFAESHLYDSHNGASDWGMDLVKIDAATMTVVGRAELKGDWSDDAMPRNFSLSANGRWAAVIIRDMGRVFVVNTVTMTVLDGDPTDEDEGGLDLEGFNGPDAAAHCPTYCARDIPNAVALSADGSTLYISYRNDSLVDVIDVATWGLTATWLHPSDSPDNDNYAAELYLHSDGNLYWVSGRGGTVAMDSAGTGTQLIGDEDDHLGASWGHKGRILYIKTKDDTIWAWDTVAEQIVDLDGDTTDGTAGPAPADSDGGHMIMVTPF